MANTFKKVIDRQVWAQIPPAPNAHGAGVSVTSDLRNDTSRTPYVYQLASATVLNKYNIVTKAWGNLTNPALAGTFGAGSAVTFAPSLALVGTIAAGATTTSVVLSTALPTAVGVNSLANRGGSGEYGYKIRIIDTTAGKTAERFIVANTSGTTPTINVASTFGFTPANGARYEILSGRVFMLNAGTTASNIWRTWEIATNTLSTGLATTNLPATIGTDSMFMPLDEQYVPYNHLPGEGMVKGGYNYDGSMYALTATASAAGTLTGQAASGDASVAANEYRNFQIRIVEDTVTPTSVGQRRIIASHTAGPSAVYTLGTNWTVTPSSSAKFVIELPNLLLMRSTATASVYTWNYSDATINNGTNSITSGAWSVTYFGNAPTGASAGGVWAPSWAIQPDVARNSRQSFSYWFRSGNASTVDLFDIAGGTTGAWTSAIPIDGAIVFSTGTTAGYAPFENEGRFTYINGYVASAVNQIYRFDAQNRTMAPFTATDYLQAGTAAVGQRLAGYAAIDGSDKYDVMMLLGHTANICQEMIVLI